MTMKTVSSKSGTGATLGGSLPVVASLDSYGGVSSVFVIGCGGTGAYVISSLSRLIKVYNSNRHRINLYLIDGDVVEEKNLIRQHFINQDIGKNKAEVLGERYSAVFGLEIRVVPKYLEKLEDFYFFEEPKGSSCSHIIIGCVDNNASRKVINEYVNSNKELGSGFYSNPFHQNIFWIDSGNEERNGQVVCGFKPSETGGQYSRKVNPKTMKNISLGIFSMPFVTEVYPDVLESDDKFNSEISCAENAISAPQNMQTNITASTIVMNYVNKIFAREKIRSHCVEFNIDNNFSTRLNTAKNLSVVNNNRRKYWEK